MTRGRHWVTKTGTLYLSSFVPQYSHLFSYFHSVLKARILKWFAISFSSGPHFVKERSNYRTIAFILHAIKVMLKILQARYQQHVNHELHMFMLVLEKEEEPEIKLPTSAGSSKKTEFQKNIYFGFIDYAKAFYCVDHNKLENSEGDGNTRPPDLPLEKSVCRSGSNS